MTIGSNCLFCLTYTVRARQAHLKRAKGTAGIARINCTTLRRQVNLAVIGTGNHTFGTRILANGDITRFCRYDNIVTNRVLAHRHVRQGNIAVRHDINCAIGRIRHQFVRHPVLGIQVNTARSGNIGCKVPGPAPRQLQARCGRPDTV